MTSHLNTLLRFDFIRTGLCVVTLSFLSVILSPVAISQNLPPKNPWLADSIYALGHGDSAQQDSLPIAGPFDKTRQLNASEIDYAAVGPAHFGSQISGHYSNGKRAIWSIGLDRIVKLDHDSFSILDQYFLPEIRVWTEQDADKSINKLNNDNSGIFAIIESFKQSLKLRSLSGIYTLMDKDNNFYMVSKQGVLHAYTDNQQYDGNITLKATFTLPDEVSGYAVGINMTYDGWLVVVTEHGYVISIKRDFSDYRVTRLKHSEGAENKTTKPTGYGWVRNGHAIDKGGGIYIVSQAHMHKVMWTGNELTTDTQRGAWSAPYNNEWGHGSGATPSLMGFDDEDQFVVITDGANVMNVVLFWRNDIPQQWQQLPNTSSRRIAGQLPANMGDATLTKIQSEQSVVVAGYGAMVVNNIANNVPWYIPQSASTLFISFMGSNPKYQPYGIQKFEWDTASQRFKEAWVNQNISSPNSVPIISYGSKQVYFVGARDNQWTLEAVDWQTGQPSFHYLVGDQRYNSLFAGTLMDENGNIFYGTTWGIVRLRPDSD